MFLGKRILSKQNNGYLFPKISLESIYKSWWICLEQIVWIARKTILYVPKCLTM